MRVQQVTDLRLSAAERRHVVRRTWRFLRPVRLRLLLAVACVLLQAAATLAGPAIVRYGIDHGVQPRDVGALDRATIAFVVSVILVYVFGRLTITAVARIGEGFLRELRQRVFAHLMRLSLEFYDRTRTGALVARMTAD
ncbi:MAG: ABC transporter ATP-binding protein [Actinobacteria bacterium]|nr:MAG: ABC transporter ATP-binding protein [Actinomycetota bacterium]